MKGEKITGLKAHRCGIRGTEALRRVYPIPGTDKEEVITTCTNCESRRGRYERKRKAVA